MSQIGDLIFLSIKNMYYYRKDVCMVSEKLFSSFASSPYVFVVMAVDMSDFNSNSRAIIC